MVACLAAYRREAVRRSRGALYNSFIRGVRERVGARGSLWLAVVEGGLGLVEGEGVGRADAEAFLLPPGGAVGEEEEEEDLLDEL